MTARSAKPPKPPSDLLRSGREMWSAVVGRLDLDRHEEQLLLEACRVADRLDGLDAAIRRGGVAKSVRLLAEARQQQSILARTLASLRLPADLTNPQHRPQRRGAARGAYRQREVT